MHAGRANPISTRPTALVIPWQAQPMASLSFPDWVCGLVPFAFLQLSESWLIGKGDGLLRQ